MREIELTASYQDALRLSRLRGQAKRHGFRLSRSRWHQPYVQNRGGLMLMDSQSNILAGRNYSLSLEVAEAIVIDLIKSKTRQMCI